MDMTLRALNRFGLGARQGERSAIADGRAWLHAQLTSATQDRLAPVTTAEAVAEALRAIREAGPGDERERQIARRRVQAIALAESRAALTQRVATDRPFIERLVAFWSNHLCVSAASRLPVAALAGSYERDVIRPHVLGRFEDMVLASARHPAMLLYLDNAQSIGPASRAANLAVRRAGAERGLNENYARELLELHTLGVNGGYTQADVTELARVLTGWTVGGLQPERAARAANRRMQRMQPAGGSARFAFDATLHEPGTRTVLGVSYDDTGVEQGERVIRDLCRHPSTARFVATKLVTHFVSDQPPVAAIDAIADVFRATNGDLSEVSHALVELPDAWDPATRKFRTPQDWLIAMLRALEVRQTGDQVGQVLRQLRQPLWSPQSPKGYGDTMVEWADPDSLLNRAEFARSVTRRFRTRNEDTTALLETIEVATNHPIHSILADSTTLAADRTALLFAGPAFQWR